MKQRIAVFDFDKTLTDRDSFLPFLFFLYGPKKTFLKMIPLLPLVVGYLIGFRSRQSIKEGLIETFLSSYSFEELKTKAEEYASTKLDQYLKPEAMERLKWHRLRGDRCLVISASLELYLKPWGDRHGIEYVVGSRLLLEKEGIISGKLEGENCWGEEKVRRLLEYAGPREKLILFVYGDSKGDYPLLKIADHPFYRSFS